MTSYPDSKCGGMSDAVIY
uniref:Uncharacterized protein n=1 Tax=Anguilla anguilla TaxID=7936 RepID=A0A0E9XAH3_ANGAN